MGEQRKSMRRGCSLADAWGEGPRSCKCPSPLHPEVHQDRLGWIGSWSVALTLSGWAQLSSPQEQLCRETQSENRIIKLKKKKLKRKEKKENFQDEKHFTNNKGERMPHPITLVHEIHCVTLHHSGLGDHEQA